MTASQKVIKYFATSLAILLIVGIISFAVFGLSVLFNLTHSDYNTNDLKEIGGYEKVEKLNIELKYSDLIIEEGDSFKVLTNNKDISLEYEDGKAVIKENSDIKKAYKKSSLVIYVPENEVFEDINISLDAGNAKIAVLNSEELKLNLGIGETNIKTLITENLAKIDSGVGKVKIENGAIKNLNLKIGVGKFSITARLLGSSKIEAGIGELNLDLLGNDYSISLETGIGEVKLNGKTVKTGTYDDGNSYIDLESGIGSININYK